jgi:DnaK suppressor protein
MKKTEREYFQNKIFDRVEVVLQNLFEDPELVLTRADGEDSVCSVCELVNKLCKAIPNFRCGESIKGNSELNELEKALTRIKTGTYGICSSCNKPIQKEILEKKLTALFCSECSSTKKAVKKK